MWSSSKRDRPRTFLAKRPDQRHEFLGPFRVIFGIGLQIFQADWRFEDQARRKSHLIRSGLRVVGSLWQLDSSLTHQFQVIFGEPTSPSAPRVGCGTLKSVRHIRR